MANILLVANLNCDRILNLDKPLEMGGRFHYQDGGKRLGGGGANTGIGLVWAKHRVALVSQVGRDKVGDWLLAEASTQGIDCHLIQRHKEMSSEMLLVMTPDGERTIIRPQRPVFELSSPPEWSQWDAVYFNSSAAQLSKDERPRPCDILIASKTDMLGRSQLSPWKYGLKIAGDSLKYFIVTDGADGAYLYTQDDCQQVDAVPSKVVDTTGAGDAYAAGLIHGITTGLGVVESMREAGIWAGFAVETQSSIPGKALKQYLSN